eukprot:TRINITY_DN9048_c0_g1_i2.p2 TRINITY_DN9048_c0_g1~~TRINITY_DN9048_c0_g1_i2.p2  ORF type:complete len:442 (-),score=35.05 TRINITY_DN9048_c0_g1_i2:1021-2346(-)
MYTFLQFYYILTYIFIYVYTHIQYNAQTYIYICTICLFTYIHLCIKYLDFYKQQQYFLYIQKMSSGQTLGVKAQRFRGHTSPHRNVKEKKDNQQIQRIFGSDRIIITQQKISGVTTIMTNLLRNRYKFVPGLILLQIFCLVNSAVEKDGNQDLLGVIKGTGRSVGVGIGREQWRGEIIRLSWQPRAYLLKGFLSDKECNYLIQHSKDKMEESIVIDNDTGAPQRSEVRTSTGTFIGWNENKIISEIEDRVAQVTMIPNTHQEAMQILRYVNGQKYEPHHDYFHDPVNQKIENGGQRLITMLMYLSTPLEGGETVFPEAGERVTGEGWSDCARKGYAVKARKGDAVMFYGLHPNGTVDPTSLHGSCPTLEGEKWSATKWIHVLPLYGKMEIDDPRCKDEHERCVYWAENGECANNPVYMRKTCRKACDTCQELDVLSINSLT